MLDTDGFVGFNSGGTGSVDVTGAGSKWTNSRYLYVGNSGVGTLNVAAGGQVTNTDGVIGRFSDSTGAVTITGTGSRWTNSGSLTVGDSGSGTLNINAGGLVTVGGTTTIGPDDNVTVGGGRFEFGDTSLTSYARIGGTSGSLTGNVTHGAFTNISTLSSLPSSSLDVSEVSLVNSGTLFGTGILKMNMTNTGTGRVDASGSSIMRFEGSNIVNHGIINSTGGMVSVATNLTNSVSGQISNFGGQIVTQGQVNNAGFITGRGEFTANGGFDNTGSMAFSGTADVNGHVTNNSLIVTSANATTTFYDSVINNGEIRTSGSGSSVFFETVSGGGSYTGTGDVFFEGNVNPGNSPGVIEFGGNLTLGTESHTVFELGGLELGDYDRFNIAGNLSILGSMSVEMWNGFELGSGMSFLIADIGGTRSGVFAGLGEGDLVGNFGGTDLFITYNGFGDNGGIGLFTAVPEPSAVALFGIAGVLGLASRRRRR